MKCIFHPKKGTYEIASFSWAALAVQKVLKVLSCCLMTAAIIIFKVFTTTINLLLTIIIIIINIPRIGKLPYGAKRGFYERKALLKERLY